MTLAHKAKATAAALCTLIAVLPPAHGAKPETRNRAEIAAEFRWDFSAIYPSWAAWEAGVADMEAKMDAFAKLKGSLAQGPAALLKAYQGYDEIGKLQYLVYRYPQLQRDVDTRDQAVAGRFQRVGALFAKFDTATSWFTPELLKVPQAIGIGEGLTASPSHTTGHTGHVSGGSLNNGGSHAAVAGANSGSPI